LDDQTHRTLVDRVELAGPGPQNFLRDGRFDASRLQKVTMADLRRAIAQVRKVNPDVPIAAGLFVAVGDEKATAPFAALFEGGLF